MNKSQSNADVKRLTAAVTDIAVISYSALGQVIAIGKLIQSWMENSEAYRNPEIISRALDSIVYIAQEAMESVGGESKSAGCEYMDANTKRRLQAAEEYRKGIEN
ncbi:TPA: hypothetical protein ACWV6N_003582 [Salmonella enterica subsp. enterica serovar Muenchen]